MGFEVQQSWVWTITSDLISESSLYIAGSRPLSPSPAQSPALGCLGPLPKEGEDVGEGPGGLKGSKVNECDKSTFSTGLPGLLSLL